MVMHDVIARARNVTDLRTDGLHFYNPLPTPWQGIKKELLLKTLKFTPVLFNLSPRFVPIFLMHFQYLFTIIALFGRKIMHSKHFL